MSLENQYLDQDKMIELVQFSDYPEVTKSTLALMPDEATFEHIEQVGDLVVHFSQVVHMQTEGRQARWHALKVMRNLGKSALASGDLETAQHIKDDISSRPGVAARLSGAVLSLSIRRAKLVQ